MLAPGDAAKSGNALIARRNKQGVFIASPHQAEPDLRLERRPPDIADFAMMQRGEPTQLIPYIHSAISRQKEQ
jgi:hypothetical protein